MTEQRSIWSAAALFKAQDPDFHSWLPHQIDAFAAWDDEPEFLSGRVPHPWMRALVFHPTGKGKTKIMLTMQYVRGVSHVLVVAPPVTHAKWATDAAMLGLEITTISHAKFRDKKFKVSRDQALIVDEFQLLGGQTGVGWKKLDAMAAGLRAPLILGSATPNWNDAERCYCIVHVLDPLDNRGGFLQWLYTHCETVENPFGKIPMVTGFRNFSNAAEFLEHSPHVLYLPDEAPDIIKDIEILTPVPDEFDEYGLDRESERIMASTMEDRHRRRWMHIFDHGSDDIQAPVWDMMEQIVGNSTTPTLIYCDHSSIAEAVAANLQRAGVEYGLVTGNISKSVKDGIMAQFVAGAFDVLVGTATMATGFDGADKMCDTMIILDDTDDASLRRQLVGRILPRGDVQPEAYAGKYAYRFVYGDR